MAQIPEHIKKYLTPAQLQEIEMQEAQSGGQRPGVLTFEEWVAQNPQYQGQGPQSIPEKKNPWAEAAKSAAKGYVKKEIKDYIKSSQTPTVTAPTGTAFSSGAVYQGQPIASMADGSIKMSTGEIVPASEGGVVGAVGGDTTANSMAGYGQAAQGALGAYQAYNGYNQFQDGDKVGGGLNMAQGANNMYAGATGSAGGVTSNAGAWLAAAQGAYNMYNASQGLGTGEQKAQNMTKAAATAVADFYTFGGASLAKKAFSKEVGKIDKVVDPIMTKYDPGTRIVGKILGESTRGAAKRHTQELFSKSDDPAYQAYVAGMREQYNSGPPDPNNPFGDTKGNKYATWDDYKKAGLDAANLTGVMGNLELGPEYTNLTPEQQVAFTQMQIDKDRYNSKKGEVLSTDLNAARQDLAEFAKSGYQAPKRNVEPGGGGYKAPAQTATLDLEKVAENMNNWGAPVKYPATPPPGTTHNSAMNAINSGFRIPVAPTPAPTYNNYPAPYNPVGGKGPTVKDPGYTYNPPAAPVAPTPLTKTPAQGATLTPVNRLMIPRASGSMAGGLTR